MNYFSDLLRFHSVNYYPEINYISHEEYYHNLNIDIDQLGPPSLKIDVKNQKIYWEFLVEIRYLNEEFFKNVRTFSSYSEPELIDASALPKKVVCAIFHKDNKKYIIWLNEEYKKKFSPFM